MCLFVTGVGALIHLYAVGYIARRRGSLQVLPLRGLFAFRDARARPRRGPARDVPRVGRRSHLLVLPDRLLAHPRSAATAGRRRSSPTASATSGSCWRCSSPSGCRLALLCRHRRCSRGRAARCRPPRRSAASSSSGRPEVAQLPLYFWLPDAMEGPTPCRTDHAATMVTAGVLPDGARQPRADRRRGVAAADDRLIGAITAALFAATIAVAQNDINACAAYSTVSQLGYMFLAVDRAPTSSPSST